MSGDIVVSLREYDCPRCGMRITQGGHGLDKVFGPPPAICVLCEIPMTLVREL